jgi:hypothetical protein
MYEGKSACTLFTATAAEHYISVTDFAGGAKKLCDIKSDLRSVPLANFEKKKRSWWQFWKKYQTYYIANYEIKFRMRPAGIEFELWYKGQRFVNDQISVDWEEGAQMSSPKLHRRSSLDRMC